MECLIVPLGLLVLIIYAIFNTDPEFKKRLKEQNRKLNHAYNHGNRPASRRQKDEEEFYFVNYQMAMSQHDQPAADYFSTGLSDSISQRDDSRDNDDDNDEQEEDEFYEDDLDDDDRWQEEDDINYDEAIWHNEQE